MEYCGLWEARHEEIVIGHPLLAFLAGADCLQGLPNAGKGMEE